MDFEIIFGRAGGRPLVLCNGLYERQESVRSNSKRLNCAEGIAAVCDYRALSAPYARAVIDSRYMRRTAHSSPKNDSAKKWRGGGADARQS